MNATIQSTWKHRLLLSKILVFCLVLTGTSAHTQQSIRNPFCSVPTFLTPNHPMGGQATYDWASRRPIILVDPYVEYKVDQILGRGGGRAFMRFLLAHECAHHRRGHMSDLESIRQLGPYALLSINPRIELDADCAAARVLRRRRDRGAILAAVDLFTVTQGPFSPTAGYPTGNQRAQTIASCGSL